FDALPAGVLIEFLSLLQIRFGTKRFIFPCYDDTTNVDVVFDESLQRYQRFADWVGSYVLTLWPVQSQPENVGLFLGL
ncbi:MAG: hypothetical protein VX930_09955, partial [Pseudomonadota bacterium]|nr:hypothetical protein [Pseudomonadota bacterium]